MTRGSGCILSGDGRRGGPFLMMFGFRGTGAIGTRCRLSGTGFWDWEAMPWFLTVGIFGLSAGEQE